MKDILEQINHKDGMTVPEGYFEDFASRMAASLPVRDWEENRGKVMPRSFWQKVRPYVYLAAMFAGVWSMMTMFDMMRPASPGLSLENNSRLTAALDNDSFINDYVINESGMDEYLIMEDLYENGFTPAEYTATDDNDYNLTDI
ncbi:MAG: hypothetical protein HFJ91_03420 [Muribaculaceae bacterium]|nr:hypothetical protein [Muribaculaceae bacterium]